MICKVRCIFGMHPPWDPFPDFNWWISSCPSDWRMPRYPFDRSDINVGLEQCIWQSLDELIISSALIESNSEYHHDIHDVSTLSRWEKSLIWIGQSGPNTGGLSKITVHVVVYQDTTDRFSLLDTVTISR